MKAIVMQRVTNQICEDAIKTAAVSPYRTSEDFAKRHSAELLSLAREQFIQDGYVIEKKAFHDAVEKVDPEVMKEVSENVDAINEALRLEYEKGRADVLKNLPRWDESQFEMDAPCVNLEWLHVGKKMIYLPDLEKLPGFRRGRNDDYRGKTTCQETERNLLRFP